VLFPPEGAAIGQFGLSSGGLTEHGGTSQTEDNGLSMRENRGDLVAAWTLHVHEE